MIDFLDTLAMDAVKTIESGYYKNIQNQQVKKKTKTSLKASIQNSKANAIITEIKAASPSAGQLRDTIDATEIALAMQKGGAIGISVLTEPLHFKGSLESLAKTSLAVNLPTLMKDIIIVPEQIDAATKLGASAILLIQALFDRRCTEMNVDKMIAYAHGQGLEVLLETHTEPEFLSARQTRAELIGINNRNLATLKIDLNTTRDILAKHAEHNRIIVSESGINKPSDLQYLRAYGADAFLIGSSIMLTEDIESKVKELVNAP